MNRTRRREHHLRAPTAWPPQGTLPGSRPGTRIVPQGPLLRGAEFVFDAGLVTSVVTTLVFGHVRPVRSRGVLLLTAFFAYYVIAEGCFGTTVGKRLLGMRIVRVSDGQRCGVLAAVVRTVMRLVDYVFLSLPGLIAITSSSHRQRYGDRAAKTMVVIETPEAVLHVDDGCRPATGLDTSRAPAGALAARDFTWPDTGITAFGGCGAAKRGGALDPCPCCDAPVRPDEVVCPYCEHYINEVTARGEAHELAPGPMLYSADRGRRFDALWRLVFAADEESLASLRTAVVDWRGDERRLAIEAFAEVDDPRPLPFLDFMAQDSDADVRAFAREVRSRLRVRASACGPC